VPMQVHGPTSEPMLRMRVLILIAAFATIAIPQTPFHRATQFEQQPALTIANDRLEATVSAQGGALVNLVLRTDTESLNPLWNPIRMERELGQTSRSRTGSMALRLRGRLRRSLAGRT
jgi:hypothetical protein